VLFVRSYGDTTRVSATPLADDLAEALRMAAGLVRVGVETEASTLALEAGLDDHCSTRKGCYTGQEIVARIHTYGHVNRKLGLLQLGGGDAIEAPATLLEPEDELPVGRVMHAVPVAGHDLRVGLGYLPKDFQALGTRLQLEGGGVATVVGFGDAADD
jgi:folate-binding protein YgfZ